MIRNKIQTLLLVALIFFMAGSSTVCTAQERRLSRLERVADRNFTHQKFDKAMGQYETAIRRTKEDAGKLPIHLKTARLYFMLRHYAKAALHYEKALEMGHALLSVDDVCNYVDALRFTGRQQQAEGVCLDNAYRDIYSRYQRYQNTLDALSMRHDMAVDPAFEVKRLSLNSNEAEFWVGYYGEQPFYARSFSEFNDPGKLFFHRTRYYLLDDSRHEEGAAPQKAPRPYDYFRRIPADMQNGPLSFSPDMQTMVTTVIEYDKAKATVEMSDRRTRPFHTRLMYSTLQYGGNRFTKYHRVFPQEDDCSYAHPFLFNEGRSLLFVSDRPGGMGGFDLYVTHFDAQEKAWGMPVNLGPQVNTEGDELFPTLFDGRLIFSSNGLPGYGGYDLFSIFFDNEDTISGGADHFPFPVNTVFNDYFMCRVDSNSAYFASDRELLSRDDLFSLHISEKPGSEWGKPFFGMNEEAAVAGGGLLIGGLTETAVPETLSIRPELPKGLLLTLYFDFDSSALLPESIRRLNQFIDERSGYRFGELLFNGYADEMGSDSYNYALSERRAVAVADFLRQNGISASFRINGLGRISLTEEEVNEEISRFGPGNFTEGIDWIRVNRRARRVEIYNK